MFLDKGIGALVASSNGLALQSARPPPATRSLPHAHTLRAHQVQVLQAQAATALLKVLLEAGGRPAQLGVPLMVLDAVGEDEEDVAEEGVNGSVVAALDAALHGAKVHGNGDDIKVVRALQRRERKG